MNYYINRYIKRWFFDQDKLEQYLTDNNIPFERPSEEILLENKIGWNKYLKYMESANNDTDD